MATTTFMVPAAGSIADDAAFRVYGKGVSDGLAAIGFVRTADTGQINWATVTKPGAANTKAGYEVWRFSDSLQSTYPIVVRIDYGTAAAATVFGLWVSVGKGSDGAGAISSTIIPVTQIGYTGSQLSPQTNYLSSGDGSMMAIMLTPASGGGPLNIILERSRTPAGAATGTALLLVYRNATSSAPVTKTFNYATPATVNMTGWPAAPPQNAAMAVGGKAPVFPAVVHDGAGNFWQPRSIVTGATLDLGTLVAVTVPGWGTYLPIGGGYFGPTSDFNSISAAVAWF